MDIYATPVTTSEEDMRTILQQEGKFNFNKLFIRNKQITEMELRYVEYFILKYHMIHKRGFFRRSDSEIRSRQLVYLLGNGSTGYTSLMEALPQTEYISINKDSLQAAEYHPDQMSLNAKTTMLKAYRRHMGGRIPDFELLETKSIYRPFWLIYYGEPTRSGKRLCSVRAADGFTVGKF